MTAISDKLLLKGVHALFVRKTWMVTFVLLK